MSKDTHESLYTTYRDDSLLRKLEYYALWTIPSTFPKDATTVQNGNAEIEHDYQSIGAMHTNRLATKLASSMFPPNNSFFRIDANAKLKEQLEKDAKQTLIEIENTACRRLLYNASYAQLVQALRLLVITGDVLIKRYNNRIRVFSLKNYVVRRNNVGEDQDIIFKEVIDFGELPENLKSRLRLVGNREDSDKITLYTRVQKITKDGISFWEETQEIDSVPVDYKATYTEKLCPYFTVKWNHVNGDMYGRGLVEEYAGDFAKLSELSQALTEYELQSCITLNIFNPAGNFDIDRAEQAVSGDWISGQRESVTTYEVGDYQKIAALASEIQEVSNRLSGAFMSSGNVRDAERVTAQEVLLNANEAEQVLGGVYSQLSQNMHLPLAYLLLNEIQPNLINAVESGEYELHILTGLQALSRSTQNQALLIAASEINAIVPVLQQVSKRFNPDKLVDGILRANGVNVADYEYTEEELKAMQVQEEEQAQQLAQQQQLLQGAGQEQAVQAVQQSQGFI